MSKLPPGWKACFVVTPDNLVRNQYDINLYSRVANHVKLGRRELLLSYLYKGFSNKSRRPKTSRYHYPLWRMGGYWNITSQYDINTGFSVEGAVYRPSQIYARLYKGVGSFKKPKPSRMPENWNSFIQKSWKKRYGAKYESLYASKI